MATQDQSITDVLKSAIRDSQDLIRGEIALAKAELAEAVSRLARVAALLAGAAVAALIAAVMLLTAAAWAISELLTWPVWTGFAIVALLTIVAAGGLGYIARKRIAAARHMPRTLETLKENLEWMRARTS
jgi:hypothetical protein